METPLCFMHEYGRIMTSKSNGDRREDVISHRKFQWVMKYTKGAGTPGGVIDEKSGRRHHNS
jgi:hypothetical protein